MIVTALIGYPTDHSVSPDLFNCFAESDNIEYSHIKCNVLPINESLKNAIVGIKTLQLRGVNVTLPYKQTIMVHLDRIDADAKKIGAVNTIHNKNGKLYGYNTDWYGALRSIESKLCRKLRPDDSFVIFGTGGAARAIIFAALKTTKNVTVIYRTPLSNNTRSLIKDYKNSIRFSSLSNDVRKYIEASNIICNATSVGMIPNETHSIIPLGLLRLSSKNSDFSQKLFFDVVFNPHKTIFLQNAEKNGAKIQEGIMMMIYQATMAYAIWVEKHVTPNTIKKAQSLLIKKLKHI